ncbi:type II toxin-antitoxin system VapC family toxin [Burkholderia multivorans]|jgi:predicted nucleic acid-binding protein|uniref:type II toxin-antitoxin system VapC family toxin n=1 Tax=Burkholderia multivorans TaxID=87883 RepID=UPI001C23A1A8|nr:type II toxin-antitoxin system VapC family toxin [Burkholderia multivorans]MBU9211625.1 type II toxin-antitoxin system VapC family toxin [Burkholderia multivorans]
MIWVVDTSAIVRLFIPDGPFHPEIEAAMNRAMHGSDVVLAPDLMLAESANVLLRKQRRGELSSGEVVEIIEAIASLPVRIEPHAPLLVAAFSLADTHDLTVYDALYLALAERHGARLMTCDDQLDRVAKTMGLGSP